MEDFFFNGIWRMDWGFDNPNKTATLIAEIIIAIWGFSYIKKWGWWLALLSSCILGGCLIHTFSRGGLIAAFCGLLTLVTFNYSRARSLFKFVAIGTSVLILMLYAIYLTAPERYTQGILKEDLSINNRIMLWKMAPAMMLDAPDGWGIGNSGNAFMRWYQPLESNEKYRTLVNSHLTWLVEFNWLLRFFYIAAWSAILLLCIPSIRSPWYVIALGIWLVFGIAAFFSSIAESPILWIIPLGSLLFVLLNRLSTRQWPHLVTGLLPVALASFFCIGIILLNNQKSIKIYGSKDCVFLGKGVPAVWVVVDERILGEYGFAKSLRRYLTEHSVQTSIGIVKNISFLPPDLSKTIVVIAGIPNKYFPRDIEKIATSVLRLVLISPQFYPEDTCIDFKATNSVEVFYGEFSQSPYLSAWKATDKVHLISGVGDFFPNWPSLIFEK